MFRRKEVKIFSVPDWSDTSTKTYDLSTVSGREQVPINLEEIKDVCFIYVRENNEYYRLISDTTNGTTRTLVFNGTNKITITATATTMSVVFSAGEGYDYAVTDPTLTLSGVAADAKATGDAVKGVNDATNNVFTLIGKTTSRDISSYGIQKGKYRQMTENSNAVTSNVAYGVSYNISVGTVNPVKYVTMLSDDYEFAILCYSSSAQSLADRVGVYGWYNSGIVVTIPEDATHFIYQVHKKDGTTITDDDVVTIQNSWHTYKDLVVNDVTDDTFSIEGKPADSKAVGDAITELENADDLLENEINGIIKNEEYIPVTFIRGSRTNGESGEALYDTQYRITTATKISVDVDTVYNINAGFRVRRYWFQNGTFVSFDGSWKTESVKFVPNYEYYLNIARVTDDDTEVADIEFFKSQVWKPLIEIDLQPNYKILAIGDSICKGSRNGGRGYVGDLGYLYTNAGVDGATISTIRDASTHWIENQLTAQTDDYGIVLMNGGINDYVYNATLGTLSNTPVRKEIDTTEYEALDLNTVAGGLEHLFSTLINKYPNAHRFFIITHKTRAYPYSAGTGGFTQEQLHDLIVNACKLYNVEIVDVYKDSVINTYFSQYSSATAWNEDHSVGEVNWVDSDKVHPLSYGYLHGYVPLIQKALISCGYKWRMN